MVSKSAHIGKERKNACDTDYVHRFILKHAPLLWRRIMLWKEGQTFRATTARNAKEYCNNGKWGMAISCWRSQETTTRAAPPPKFPANPTNPCHKDIEISYRSLSCQSFTISLQFVECWSMTDQWMKVWLHAKRKRDRLPATSTIGNNPEWLVHKPIQVWTEPKVTLPKII